MSPDNRLKGSLDELLSRADAGWRPTIEAWRRSEAGARLVRFVDGRRDEGAAIYPAEPLRALSLTPLSATRVVILGQDPYHGAGQAEGLAFSVPKGVRPPPSLRNIGKEVSRSTGQAMRHGHLGAWALQGVLLLNAVLTVEEGRPASHAKQGWEALTDSLIGALAAHPWPKVFMLWGAFAQSKAALIERGAASAGHLVLQCNHPSPLSATRGEAPFIGCDHFRRAAEFTGRLGPPITWALD